MDELVTKYFAGEITASEKKQLFAALNADVNLKKEFIAMQNIHALSSWIPTQADEAIAVGKLLDFKQSHRKKSSAIPLRHIIGYAATLCITVFSTWMVARQYHAEHVEKEEVLFEEFSTPSGQRAQLKLHDGTTVWLNARSTLRYPNKFSKEERKVELNGEAFFEVKPNREVPFIVSTDKVDIKVFGTKFNVFAYKGYPEFNTSLIEGAVDVYNKDNESEAVRLRPHECALLLDDKLQKFVYDNSDFLLWKEGIYAFDDAPFSEIIKKLELYYDVTIIQNNKKLDQYRFSGKFRQRDGVENVLETLQKVYDFSFVKDKDTNRITIR